MSADRDAASAAATRMTQEEVHRFLDDERTLVLVTLRPDGAPMAHALWFVRIDDALYVNTRANSIKARNVRLDDRVCALVEAGESYFALRGVRVEGRASLVEDPGEVERVRSAQTAKDVRLGSGLEELPAWFSTSRKTRLARGDRVILRIPMQRVFSWDFGKVEEHYARAAQDPR